MITRTFARIYGIVFLLVGIAGFIPGLTQPHEHPNLAIEASSGLLFGLFPVNVVHNVIHLAFGIWGLTAARSYISARGYARATAIIYAVLTVMGLIGGANTTFGLAPIYGHDVWLHALLAGVAAYFGFVNREVETPASQSARVTR